LVFSMAGCTTPGTYTGTVVSTKITSVSIATPALGCPSTAVLSVTDSGSDTEAGATFALAMMTVATAADANVGKIQSVVVTSRGTGYVAATSATLNTPASGIAGSLVIETSALEIQTAAQYSTTGTGTTYTKNELTVSTLKPFKHYAIVVSKVTGSTLNMRELALVGAYCPANSYMDATGACVDCSTLTAAPLASTAAGACSSCTVAGEQPSSDTGVCTACEAGKYLDSGTKLCTNCAARGYSAASAVTCTACPNGKTSVSPFTACVDCAAGKFRNVATATNWASIFRVTVDAGGSAYIATPPVVSFDNTGPDAGGASLILYVGTTTSGDDGKVLSVSVLHGGTGYTTGPLTAAAFSMLGCTSAGTYTGTVTAGAVSAVVVATAGTGCTGGTSVLTTGGGTGATFAVVILKYSAGNSGVLLSVVVTNGGSKYLTGTILSVGAGGATFTVTLSHTCTDCASTFYSAAGAAACVGSGTCHAAGGVFLKTVLDGSTCLPCGAGKYWDTTGSACVNCAAGKYRSAASAFDSTCLDCAPGSSAAAASGSCTACTAGTYQDGTMTACSPCALGTYSLASSTVCTANCPAGSHATATRGCLSCDASKYYAGGVATECVSCSAGQYAAAGSSACTECPQGTYYGASTVAPNKCTKCLAGTYNSQTGKTGASDCAQCTVGKFAEAAGAILCTECQAGKYAAGLAATECLVCDEGKFSGAGASACTTCAAGTYQSSTGSSTCRICPPATTSTAGATSSALCTGPY
jgi:hypothetical protein